MARKYKLSISFADGKGLCGMQEILIQELLEFSLKVRNARNPRSIYSCTYDASADVINAILESEIPLEFPGRSLGRYSQALLNSYDQLQQRLRGTRLLKIDSEELIDAQSEKRAKDISNAHLLKIIADLLLEETTIKEKHQRNAIIHSVKEVLISYDYITDNFL